MSDIYPYAQLADDPTSSVIVSWVDDRTDADGSEQTLEFDDGSETSEGEEVPESGGSYKYEVEINGLDPNSDYSGTIDGEESVGFETLPESLEDGAIDFVVVSDQHIDRDNAMPDSGMMEPLADEDPDLLIINADLTTDGYQVDEDNTDDWLRFWDEYLGILQENKLVPIVMTVGNHEVGNMVWDGTGSVDPEAGYYQFWFSNIPDTDPQGENYGEISVGDALQILALDTHSAYADDVAEWMDDAYNPHANLCLPIHHAPLMPGGYRTDEDEDLSQLLREEWGPFFDDKHNIMPTFSGHIHLRSRSVPWTVTASEPSGDDYFEVGDRYIIENPDEDDRIIEFGGGYRAGRDPEDDWFLDVTEEVLQFYSCTLERQSDPTLTVQELDEDGNLYSEHTFVQDEEANFAWTTVATIGDATLGDVTFGG